MESQENSKSSYWVGLTTAVSFLQDTVSADLDTLGGKDNFSQQLG